MEPALNCGLETEQARFFGCTDKFFLHNPARVRYSDS
jgi:hypothetical protein